jgi:hypothetical protein
MLLRHWRGRFNPVVWASRQATCPQGQPVRAHGWTRCRESRGVDVSPALANGSGAVLTRSRIETWDTAHLDDAAARWRAMADESEGLFDRHRQNIAAPGGTQWAGQAKDTAWERVTADSGVVQRQCETQRGAADIAAHGAGDLRAAQRKALDAIAEAEADGFKVGEDLAVTDARRVDLSTAAARQSAANEHAEYIRWNAEQLAATDSLIGEQLTAKAAQLEGIRFEGSGRDETIQAVDFNTMPQSPRLPFPEKPWEYNLDFTSEVEAYGANVPGGETSAGAVTSSDDVWKELQRCFNCNFPMGGAPKEFPKVGDKLPLEIKALGQKLASFPVEVTQI